MNLTSCIKGGDERGRPGWLIQFRYDEETVQKLKSSISHLNRQWNPATKTWWIDEVYEPELDQLFGNFYALAKMQGTLL